MYRHTERQKERETERERITQREDRLKSKYKKSTIIMWEWEIRFDQ